MRRIVLALALAVGVTLTGCSGSGPEPPGTAETGGPTSAAPTGSTTAAGADRQWAQDAGSSTASTLDRVKRTKRLRICTTGDYRPFTYLDPKTRTWSGIDVSMGRDLARQLGAKPQFVQTTWDDLVSDVQSRCDVGMGGISITTERAQEVYLSDATLRDGKTPITLCSRVSDYRTLKQINRPSVDVITPVGGTNEDFAEQHFPQAHVIRWKDNNTIFDQIVAGRADVMVTDASETKWVAHTDPKLCAVHPERPFTFSEQGYLVHLGDDVMREFVNQWLRIAQHDGTYASAEQPWFG